MSASCFEPVLGSGDTIPNLRSRRGTGKMSQTCVNKAMKLIRLF